MGTCILGIEDSRECYPYFHEMKTHDRTLCNGIQCVCECACVPLCLIYKHGVLTSTKQNTRTFHDSEHHGQTSLPLHSSSLPNHSVHCVIIPFSYLEGLSGSFPLDDRQNCAVCFQEPQQSASSGTECTKSHPTRFVFYSGFFLSLLHVCHTNPLLSWLGRELLWFSSSLSSIFPDHRHSLRFQFYATSLMSGTPSRLLNFSFISAFHRNNSPCHTM